MKRTVLYILLLANLFSGLAFAWDSHPEAMAGHEANHCCHGAAHLIGFIHEPATPLLLAGGKHPFSPPAPLLSLPIAPHLRPPIA